MLPRTLQRHGTQFAGKKSKMYRNGETDGGDDGGDYYSGVGEEIRYSKFLYIEKFECLIPKKAIFGIRHLNFLI